ncbi:MAG: HlyD family efflux transporter periplasmic adaptor subunit [Ignavibacteriae bacterium]|nr:HlyD family efflux transporter periplasmic adaptor subunit [Ignavibacteriota bacterium]MCB9208024.1 HlyD family efflux transporter periplasmic adaptor subunit [Ignavibacteriales bacterium]
MSKNKLLFIALVIAFLIIIFLPIEYPISVKSKGKLLPLKTWILAKGTDGRLLTSLTDNSSGITNHFSASQFERGDAVQFNLNQNLIEKGNVTLGDTIGYVISNEIEKNIQKLKSELETSKASLRVQTSSQKQSIIEEEKRKLEFAEKELEEQSKIYNRKKLLFERDLISQQEFEADEARYELAKININIAKERLKTVESGAKEEEISFAESQIRAIENEINILQKRYESNNIISPITGSINRTYSVDTLLVISDTSKYVILMPIKWNDSRKVQVNQSMSVSLPESNEIINGIVSSIGNNVNTYSNYQYVMVTAISENKLNDLKPGLYVDCKINCGNSTAIEYFKSLISGW